MHKEMLAVFLHLYHSYGSRRAGLAKLLAYFDDDPVKLRGSSANNLKATGLKSSIVAAIRATEHPQVALDLAWARASQNHLVCYLDADYPELLRQIDGFPTLLYARGDPALLQYPQIAIVGSRHCTPGGAQTAFDFAAQLAASGMTITSGMALGIDAEAHRGALQSTGRTIAVVGTGVDLVYPQRNRNLAEKILKHGLMLSELPLGSRAQPANFPQRNRIISGLSLATLVVEAAQRSGSLITARLAAEQGREVFAVPGSIHNPQTRGCHQLIRDGATLIEAPDHVCNELGSLFSFVRQAQSLPPETQSCALDLDHQRLLEAIGYDPVNCDILVQRSGLTIDKLSSMLLLLELNDLIQSAPGGCFVRI